MPNKTNLFIILLTSIFALTGCKTVEIKDINTGFSPTSNTLKYNVSDFNLSNQQIFQLAAKEFKHQLNVVPKYRQRSAANTPQTVRGTNFNQTSCSSDTQCSISVTYYNGEYYSSTRNTYTTDQSLTIPFQLSRKDGVVTVKAIISGKAQSTIRKNPIFLPYSEILSSHQILSLFEKISNLKPTLTVKKAYKGNFNVNQNDNVVYANFKRLMGLYRNASDQDKTVIGKNSIFNLNTPNGVSPLGVEVYPSSKGTIVDYSFSLNHEILPNGEKATDKALVKSLKRSISQTASL